MAITEVSKVPVTKGRIPKCFSAKRGVHCVSVRKSNTETRVKKTEDSEIKTHRIPAVVRMLIAAHSSRAPSMIFSFVFITCVQYSKVQGVKVISYWALCVDTKASHLAFTAAVSSSVIGMKPTSADRVLTCSR